MSKRYEFVSSQRGRGRDDDEKRKISRTSNDGKRPPALRLKKVRTIEEGDAPRESKGTNIINKSTTLYDEETGELVAIFLKNVLPEKMKMIGRKLINFRGKSDSRGAFAGNKKKTLVKSGKHKGMHDIAGKSANSSLVGYLLPYLVKNPKPQLSSFSKKDLDLYEGELKTLYKYVDGIIKRIDPQGYKGYLDNMRNVPNSVEISKLITNVQVNVNQIAHYHIDNGNANQYGTLLTFYPSGVEFTGGEFILGEYNTAFNLKEGDMLYVNQFSPHGTLPFNGDRLSAVGFQAKKILKYYDKQKGEGKDSDIVYVIPSYKRKDVLIKKTLSVLEKYNIPKKDIYVFVANAQQKNEYKEVEDMGYKLIIAKKGVLGARNFIVDYFKEGQKIVSLDDDIRELVMMVNKKKTKVLPDLSSFIKGAFDELEKNNLQLGGIYPIDNPFFMKKKISKDLRYIAGGLYFFINDKTQKINPKFHLGEDYARSIKSFIKYGGVLRYNYISFKTQNYTKEGGLADARKGTIKGEPPEVISKKALYKMYPDYIIPIEKKGQFDIKLKKISSKDP